MEEAPPGIVTIIRPDSSKLEPVLPPRYDSQMIWHYTNTAGVLGIVSNNGLWASSVWSMNDSGELTHGVDFVRALWAKVQDKFSHSETVDLFIMNAAGRMRRADAFVACASKDPESLSQWRAYGSYAVGINPAMRLQVRSGVDRPPSTERWTREKGEAQKAAATGWREVVYSETAKVELATRLFGALNELARHYRGDGSEESRSSYLLAMELFFCCVAFMKHEAFSDEREVRLLTHYFVESPGVRLRSSRFGIVPYVVVEAEQTLLSDEVDFQDSSNKRFPLTAIHLGPGLEDPRAAKEGLEVALVLNDQRDILVTGVEIPFR